MRQRYLYGVFQFLDHFIGRPNVVKLFGKARYEAFLDVSRTLEAKGDSRIIEVERRKNLSIEEFRGYYHRYGIPVIMEGEGLDWACTQKWSFDYFKDQYGEDQVPMVDAFYLEKGVKYMKFQEVIEEILAGKSSYLRFYHLLQKHPELFQDVNMDWFKSRRGKFDYGQFTQVFIGGKDSITGLHNENGENLFLQLSGEKEWYLYPNYFVPLIDPPSTTGGTYRVAPRRGKGGQPFNAFAPDYEDYPLYKFIDGYHAILKPGDILYNPPYMWHTVRNITEGLGLAYRWISPTNALKVAPLYYLLDLMAFKPFHIRAYRWYLDDGNKELMYVSKMLRKQQEKKRKRELKKS